MKLDILILALLGSFCSFGQGASFTQNVTQGCVPLIVDFQNSSSGTTSYYWSFGDGLSSTLEHPSHTFNGTNTSFQVMMIAFDALLVPDTAYVSISTLGELPTFNMQDSACPGELLVLSAKSDNDPGNQFIWDFDDGSIMYGEDVQYAFSDTGVYMVVLELPSANCGLVYDSSQIVITSSIVPLIHIHPGNFVPEICVGGNFPWYYDESLSVEWFFGDGTSSTDPFPFHLYDSAGVYNIQITITNECGNSNTMDTSLMVLNDLVPNASYYSGPPNKCVGEITTFYAFQSFGSTYEWIFDDTITLQGAMVDHAFYELGGHSMQMIVTNLCGNTDTASGTINIFDDLIPNTYGFVNENFICPNESTLLYGGSGYDSAYWVVGIDTILYELPVVFFDQIGANPVEYHVINACGIEQLIHDTVWVVDSSPLSLLIIATKSNLCIGENVSFEANYDQLSTFEWSFGDGVFDTLDVVSHNYGDTGVYTIKLIASNGCGIYDTASMIIVVDESSFPIVNYTYLNSPSVCAGSLVEFINLSSDTLNAVWDFGNGDIVSGVDPWYSFPLEGNYFVSLQVANSCGNTAVMSKLITVSGTTPFANISISDSSVYCLGDTIEVQNSFSNGWFTSEWLTLNNTSVISASYFESMQVAGWDEIKLIVYNECGADTELVNVEILADVLEPELYCDTTLDQCLLFTWSAVPGASYYEVNVDELGWNAVGMDTSMTFCLLGEFLNVSLKVRAVRDGICSSIGASNESDCSIFANMGGLQSASGLAVFPNPLTDQLHIQSVDKFSSVEVFNLLGKSVFKYVNQTETLFESVYLGHVPNGVYILSINGSRFSSSKRIIVQRL